MYSTINAEYGTASKVHSLINVSSWSTIGALITIFCLAFDPLYQLLVKFEQRQIYQDSALTTVKRAETFEHGPRCESQSSQSASDM